VYVVAWKEGRIKGNRKRKKFWDVIITKLEGSNEARHSFRGREDLIQLCTS
jgi:hypothetical protein